MPPSDDKSGILRSPSPAALEQRAALSRQLRQFFWDRGFIEVETPLLAAEVIPELHIDPMAVQPYTPGKNVRGRPLLLQSSPEAHMKRLLVAGMTAIFQVTRSFRAGERGQLHNPEFTIVEWYRAGDDMQAGMDLLDELMRSLIGTTPAARTSYANAFQRHVGVCPHTATIDELAKAAVATDMPIPDELHRFDRDQWLNLLLALRVEQQLGQERPEIIYHYAASQASLAKVVTTPAGYDVAERFELYYRGIELANGFHELSDAAELRQRFTELNATRVADGGRALPLPERFLAAMNDGLPGCTGCALGFDRLVMLATGARSIGDIMAFANCHDMIQNE